jgi:class 3 adenylate cyclase
VTTEGDSFTVAFHEPFDAVAWALALQTALMEVDWPKQLLKYGVASHVTAEEDGFGAGQPVFHGLRVRAAITTGEGTRRTHCSPDCPAAHDPSTAAVRATP